MVDRDFTFGAITVRLGNCATWCGTMVQPASAAGVQILSYTFTPAGGTAWSEKNPEPRDPGVSGSGLLPVGTSLQALDSLVVFYKRPGDTAYSRNNDALAIVVVPYALDPANDANMVRPSAIGNPNTNATIAAHRAEQLWFNTATANALPSIIDLDVLVPVAGWPSWSNARPTMATVSGWFAGFCGELWSNGYDIAGQTPSRQNEGYGRTVSYRTAFGMMMALSKEGTTADRKEMARRVTQWGVDLYGAYVEGRNDKVDGGHYQGRKALVVWAGHFLEKSWVDATATFGATVFHEDEQYYTASPAWVFGWPYGYKGNSDYPTAIDQSIASWGAHYPTMKYLTGYFEHCTGTNIGQALAMRLIGRTAEMGVAHDGMMQHWMDGPDASTLAAIDAIVVTAINPETGQVHDGHPRNIPWGTSYASSLSGDGYDRFAQAAWTVYSDYAAPSGGPEIEVSGLSSAILDGDSTPTVVDGTSFGTVQQGGATVTSSFVVTNVGDSDLVISGVTVPTGFTNTGPSSGTLPSGAAAVLTVRLDTATAGTKSGDVTITSNDANEGTYNFAVLGVVNAAPTFPNIQVTGGSGNFSPIIADGDSTPSTADGTDFGSNTQSAESGARVLRTFTVANAGDATLTISSVTVPTGYTVTTALPGSIAVGASAPLVVGLDLATLGTKSGDITINSNDPDTAAHNFAVTGTVVAPPTLPDISVDDVVSGSGFPAPGDNRNFGSVTVGGSTASRSFVVNNGGTGALTISSVTVPTGFTITTALDSTIAPGGTDTLIVRLDASVVGIKTGNVVIASDDPEDATFTFVITGQVNAVGGGSGGPPPLTFLW